MNDPLIEKCQNGDREAFTELFRLHGEMIQKVAYRLIRNQDLQRDVFSDVVERVIKYIHRYNGDCLITTWIYRITVNAAMSVLQKEQTVQQGFSFDERQESISNNEPGALNTMVRQEIHAAIRTTILHWPTAYREVFALFYFADQSLDEISGATGKTESSLKAILHKGRLKIEKELKKKGLMDI